MLIHIKVTITIIIHMTTLRYKMHSIGMARKI